MHVVVVVIAEREQQQVKEGQWLCAINYNIHTVHKWVLQLHKLHVPL